jgi:hypothetical protein
MNEFILYVDTAAAAFFCGSAVFEAYSGNLFTACWLALLALCVASAVEEGYRNTKV